MMYAEPETPSDTPDTVVPQTHAVRRAVAAIATAMHADEVGDAAGAVAMSWAVLHDLHPEPWARLVEPTSLGEHPALAQLSGLARAVVSRDPAAIDAACVQAHRWSRAFVERLGGTSPESDELRRQQHDIASAVAVPQLVGHDESLETYFGLLHRIGSRLVLAARDLTMRAGEADMSHDLGFQLQKGCDDFGWWMEGTHLVLAGTEGRLQDPAARDLVAEMRAVIVPLHLGFDRSEDMLRAHVILAGQRHLQILSAVERYLEDPEAPLDWSVDDDLLHRWMTDITEVKHSFVQTGELAAQRVTEIEDWARALVAMMQSDIDPDAVLRQLEKGYAAVGAHLEHDPPEIYGKNLHAHSIVTRSLTLVAQAFGVSPAVMLVAAMQGTLTTDPEVRPTPERLAQIGRRGRSWVRWAGVAAVVAAIAGAVLWML